MNLSSLPLALRRAILVLRILFVLGGATILPAFERLLWPPDHFVAAASPGAQIGSRQAADWRSPAISPAAPTTEWIYHKSADHAHPDGHEQQAMWLMNRARANPALEGVWLATSSDPEIAGGRDWFGVNLTLLQNEFAGYPAKPPAAFDVRLYTAAKAHSDDLIARDAQDHTGQFARIVSAGFIYSYCRGNVFAYASSSLNAHAAWNIDWGYGDDGMQDGRGHRLAVMSLPDAAYTNVGLALVYEDDPTTDVGTYVSTGNYCNAGNVANQFNRFIVGTVWRDQDGDDFYDPGEGLGGVTVTPDLGTYYAITADSGGYAIPATEGTYQVTFSGAVAGVRTVVVGSVSALLDFQDYPEKVYLPVTLR